MAKQTYTAYVKKYPDLEKAFQKNKGSRFPTAAAFGKYHYEKHGKSEGRSTAGGGAPSGNVPGAKGGGDKDFEVIKSGRVSSNDAYDATRIRQNWAGTGAVMAAQSDSLYQQGDSYDWKVTGALQDLPRRKGMFGTMRAEKRIPMMLEGQKGYARVENMNESDKSKWKFIFQPTGIGGKERFDYGEGPPDVYLGNLFKAKPADSKNVGVKKNDVNEARPVDSGGDSGSQNISNAISSLDSQYANAIADLTRAAMGIPKDAPAWVKTHADYLRWLRIRSGDSGFESTIVTSAVGVKNSSLATGVKTKTLMVGA
jgi:hypothetical protein